VEELSPERLYLFGSRARGDARENSDYDLLLLVTERVGDGLDMERRAYATLAEVAWPVDIVILTSEYFEWMLGAAASLSSTVKREGRLVYAA
jgi:predicted nucleotidyltransferase